MVGELSKDSAPNSRDTLPLEAMSKDEKIELGKQLAEIALRNIEDGSASQEDIERASIIEATYEAVNNTTSEESSNNMTTSEQSNGESSSGLFVADRDMNMEDIKRASGLKATDGISIIGGTKNTDPEKLHETLTSDEEGTESTHLDTSIDELTSDWAKARDEKDTELGIATQDKILQKVMSEKNIPDDHKQALMDRMSDMADAKRGAQNNTGENEPVYPTSLTIRPETSESLVVVTEEDPSIQAVKKALNSQGQEKPQIDQEASPETSEKPLEDLTLDELVTKWAEALDNEDGEAGKNIQNDIFRRVREGNKSQEEGWYSDTVENGEHTEVYALKALADSRRKKKDGEPEKDPTITGEPEAEPVTEKKDDEINLELIGEHSDDALKKLFVDAMDIDAKEHAENKFTKSKNIVKRIISGIKHNRIFLPNTQVLKAKELLDMAREKTDNHGFISYDDYAEILVANGIEPNEAQKEAFSKREASFLGIVKENLDGLNKDLLETPAQQKIRASITEVCVDYVGRMKDLTLSPKERADIEEEQKKAISEIIGNEIGFDQNNEDERRKLEFYADNASELLRNVLAISDHGKDMDKLSLKLSEMKINICERQSDSNNTYPTAQLEKVDRLSKKWNVASVAGKTSFVIGSWIATGVVANAAIKGARLAQTSGTTSVMAACGSLLGPAGALVGIGVGVGASALWGRYMARRRETEQSGLLASNADSDNGFALDKKGRRELQQYQIQDGEDKGNLRTDLTDADKKEVDRIMSEHKIATKMETMKPKQESMAEITEKIKNFLEPKSGLPSDFDKNDINNYQLRTDLQPDEIVERAKLAKGTKHKFARQKTYNDTAQAISNELSSQSGLRRTLRTKVDANSRSLNLFSAYNQNYLPELYQLSTFLAVIDAAVDADIAKKETFDVTIGGGTTKKQSLEEYIEKIVIPETDTDITTIIDNWQSNVNKSINKAGRKAALVAGGATLLISTATSALFAVVAEKQSGGAAETWLDYFKKNSGYTGPKTPVNVPCTTANGKATFTLPDGSQTSSINLQPDGSISAADELLIEQTYGINIDQVLTPNGTTTITGGELLKSMNAQPGDVDVWNYNEIIGKSDGTEFGFHKEILSDGSVKLTQNAGRSFNGGQSYDIIPEGAAGNVFMRYQDGGNLLVSDVPMTVVGNHLETTIPAGDLANAVASNALHNVGPVIVRPDGIIRSIAAEVGRSGSITTETFTNIIKAAAELPSEAVKKALAWFSTGVMPTATKSYYENVDGYGYKPGEKPETPANPPVTPVTPISGKPTEEDEPFSPVNPTAPTTVPVGDGSVAKDGSDPVGPEPTIAPIPTPGPKPFTPTPFPPIPQTPTAGGPTPVTPTGDNNPSNTEKNTIGEKSFQEMDDKEFNKAFSAVVLEYDESDEESLNKFKIYDQENSRRYRLNNPEVISQPINAEKPKNKEKTDFDKDLESYQEAKNNAQRARFYGEIEAARQSEQTAQAILDRLNNKKTTKISPNDINVPTDSTEAIAGQETTSDKEVLTELQKSAKDLIETSNTFNPDNIGDIKARNLARIRYQEQLTGLAPQELESIFQKTIKENSTNPIHNDELQILINELARRDMLGRPSEKVALKNEVEGSSKSPTSESAKPIETVTEAIETDKTDYADISKLDDEGLSKARKGYELLVDNTKEPFALNRYLRRLQEIKGQQIVRLKLAEKSAEAKTD